MAKLTTKQKAAKELEAAHSAYNDLPEDINREETPEAERLHTATAGALDALDTAEYESDDAKARARTAIMKDRGLSTFMRHQAIDELVEALKAKDEG